MVIITIASFIITIIIQSEFLGGANLWRDYTFPIVVFGTTLCFVLISLWSRKSLVDKGLIKIANSVIYLRYISIFFGTVIIILWFVYKF